MACPSLSGCVDIGERTVKSCHGDVTVATAPEPPRCNDGGETGSASPCQLKPTKPSSEFASLTDRFVTSSQGTSELSRLAFPLVSGLISLLSSTQDWHHDWNPLVLIVKAEWVLWRWSTSADHQAPLSFSVTPIRLSCTEQITEALICCF